MLEIIIILSLVNVNIIFCLFKWKVIEMLEVHYLDEPVCVFCLCFWVAAFTTFALGCFMPMFWHYVVIPFACASLQFVVLKKILE